MQTSYSLPLTEYLTGTLTIRIKVGKETLAQAMRMGIDPEELENIAAFKLMEIDQQISGLLGVESSAWNE